MYSRIKNKSTSKVQVKIMLKKQSCLTFQKWFILHLRSLWSTQGQNMSFFKHNVKKWLKIAFRKFSKLSELLWAWFEHNRQKLSSSWIRNWVTASMSEQQNDSKSNIKHDDSSSQSQTQLLLETEKHPVSVQVNQHRTQGRNVNSLQVFLHLPCKHIAAFPPFTYEKLQVGRWCSQGHFVWYRCIRVDNKMYCGSADVNRGLTGRRRNLSRIRSSDLTEDE